MRFWDSSAVVALLAAEEARARAVASLADDPVILDDQDGLPSHGCWGVHGSLEFGVAMGMWMANRLL